MMMVDELLYRGIGEWLTLINIRSHSPQEEGLQFGDPLEPSLAPGVSGGSVARSAFF